jgi:CBS domain-containing protein
MPDGKVSIKEGSKGEKMPLCNMVKLIMHTKVQTITSEKSIIEASKSMLKEKVGCLVVVDGQNVVGMISKKDISDALAKSITEKTIKDIMSSPVTSVEPDDCIIVASNIMIKKNIQYVPVIKENKLVGIITQTEIHKFTNSNQKEKNFKLAKTNLTKLKERAKKLIPKQYRE